MQHCLLASRIAVVALVFTLVLALATGCIGAPAVVIVDRRTALEQQASGSFRGLEEELEQSALSPRPATLTPAQLGAAGVQRAGLEASEQENAGNDPVVADTLLVKRCLGESLDGTLVLTVDPCTGTIDVPLVGRMIERINRERRQLWRWLAGQAPGSSEDTARTAWREIHLSGLVCGGQFQAAGGAWEIKRC